MKVDYYLNGQAVTPVNRGGIYIEVNHDQQAIIDRAVPRVGINNLYFAREDVRRIMDMLSSPPGITEGIPFEIRIRENGQSESIQLYLDMMKGLELSRDGVQATVKMLQSLDWFNDKVDGFTFESMYNETGVTPFIIDGITYTSYKQFFDQRCIYVPYVISSIPNWHDAALMLFGIVFTGTQLYSAAKDLVGAASALATNPFQWGELARIIEITLYITALLITLTSLLNHLLNCLIQPLKYHGAMLMSDLLKISAAKLGFTSQSSIWDQYPYNQIAYIPEKYSPVRELTPSVLNIFGMNFEGIADTGYTLPNNGGPLGTQRGYFNGTGGDFLRLLKTFCNGKFIIPNSTSTLQVERRDYFPSNNTYRLPDIRQDWHTYNTDELHSTTILKFLSDLNEKNCIEHRSPSGSPFFPGTIMQITHSQVTTTNQALVCLKGLKEIQIAAARGVAKDSLTIIEKGLSGVTILYDLILGVTRVLSAVSAVILDTFIAVADALIFVWNTITTIINSIIDVVNTLPGVNLSHISDHKVPYISFINPGNAFTGAAYASHDFSNRLQALLVENDMLSTPKIVMVDTARAEFAANRIAFLHNDNASVVNTQHLWDKFYYIDAFVNPSDPNDKTARRTKITPELNHTSDKNRFTLSLRDFKNLIDYPQFQDNFGEIVEADSVQWFIEQNGAAEFSYRKAGWLKSPQHPNVVKRAEEININLKLLTTLPDGQ